MQNKIQAVFFDAGNTLVYLDYAYIAEELGRSGIEVSAEDVRHAELIARGTVDKRIAEGNISDPQVWDLYFRTMFTTAGLDGAAAVDDTLRRIRKHNEYMLLWRFVPDEVFDALATLRAAGYKLGIISNNDGSLEKLLAQTNLTDKVDFALDSHVVGSEKPDPGIFRRAMGLAGVPPEACVHVGDIESADVVGAKGVGIYPVLLDPTGTKNCDCESIRSIGEIVDVVKRLDR